MNKTYLSILLLMLVMQVQGQEKTKKALFVIVDGIPKDVVDTVDTPNIDAVAAEGGFTKAIMGGDPETYSETPTISAVGYNSLLTGTWANKHNVWGNSIKQPNYYYPTIFRAFKTAYPSKKTAIYSTWLDNRTKLVGANLPATGHFSFDYYYDGMEIDTLHFPHDEQREFIHLIDEVVSKEAATHVRKEGPDLAWVYLEYSDDMGHKYGNSPEMIDGVKKADVQIGRIWEAIKYREANFEEDWMLVVTTDHGRTESGDGHGGQSERERAIWIATNADNLNGYFKDNEPEMVDIFPSIAHHLELSLPKGQAMELDGVSFVGQVSAADFEVNRAKESLKLTWKAFAKGEKGRVWIASSNNFQKGGLDNYWDFGAVNLDDEAAAVSLDGLDSKLLKVVLETPSGYLNYWVVEE
ncbi:alkaline phosphatase family protein [Echinicola strongylocentroti]|uniref:Alkaline phosphatase family protein n=1 Tax=Echinicola strongylocentroti TaxID=1795355 RepID=A0A2Z4IF57_9BACT|nr:alkaline phosphatase family protein [Echinicola strongylocentroti]AWW29722.1 alkaline phosphatase family protein [Echinicola strongylocentroti]